MSPVKVFVSAYPVHSVFDFQIRNYLIGFGPDAYIAKNSGLTETDVVAIKSAMTSPLNDVFDKVLVKVSVQKYLFASIFYSSFLIRTKKQTGSNVKLIRS